MLAIHSNSITKGTECLNRKGELIVRLATDQSEILSAQKLRYQVFYEELRAVPDAENLRTRTDKDRFDEFCDHLIVVRNAVSDSANPIMLCDGELVGTYRLLRQEISAQHGGFYTAGEFNIDPILAQHPELKFLELGRSCVLRPYRTKPVVELLWQGIWDYVHMHELDVMLGCASFEGTEPQAYSMALSYLAQNCIAPEMWKIRALEHRYCDMNLLAPELVDSKQALRQLPPLIKGYLRLGCYIGDGAVVDYQFNTIDVLIILPVSAITPRYFSYFGTRQEKKNMKANEL